MSTIVSLYKENFPKKSSTLKLLLFHGHMWQVVAVHEKNNENAISAVLRFNCSNFSLSIESRSTIPMLKVTYFQKITLFKTLFQQLGRSNKFVSEPSRLLQFQSLILAPLQLRFNGVMNETIWSFYWCCCLPDKKHKES